MSKPSIYDLADLSAPLTAVGAAFLDSQNTYVASKVFPTIPSTELAGKFPIVNRGDLLRVQAGKRAPTTEAPHIAYGVTASAIYLCEEYAAAKLVSDAIRSVRGYDDERVAARAVVEQVLLAREVDWANAYFKPGVWTTGYTPGTLWSAAGSKPIDDIATQMLAAQRGAGKKFNTLVMGPNVWARLKSHADLIGRMTGGATAANPALVNEVSLAAILGIENVYIAEAVRNTAAENQPSNFQFIAGNHALLTYVSPNPALTEPSAGYTMVYQVPGAPEVVANPTGIPDASLVVKRFRDPKKASWQIEASMHIAHVKLASDFGVFFANVIS